MEKLVSVIYEFLANILIYVAFFPNGIGSAGNGVLLGVAMLGGIISVIIVLNAIYHNNGRYDFPAKLAIGGIWVLLVTHFAILKVSDLNIMEHVSQIEFLAAGIFLIVVIGFVVVNFLLDFQMGKMSLMLWMSEFLFAASVIRLWSYIKGTDNIPQYEKLMLISRVVDPVNSAMKSVGLQEITGIFEYILLIILMFITVYYLFRTKHFVPNEWLICVIGQIMAGTSYLLYEVHDGIPWRMDLAFMVFLLFCTGWILNLVMFFYEIRRKDQNGCIGAFFIGVSGIFWNFAVVFAVDMAKKGAVGKSLDRISGVMTDIYHFIPYGRHTDFKEGNPVLPVFGALIAIVLAVLFILILFLILGKVLNYGETGVQMSAAWFRNCSIVLIVPIIVYWNCSRFGNIFGESYPWVSLMIQAFTEIGLALCISNIAPAFRKGFLGQMKLILISTVSALLVSVLLVPAVLALI